MKRLVTPEVYNKAVESAKEMAICKNNFSNFYKNFLAKTALKELNNDVLSVLKNDFEEHLWYTALFPVNEITLHDPNAPAPQTVDLQRILQAVESTKLYLMVHPDNEPKSECEDNIDSLQAAADYIISLSK